MAHQPTLDVRSEADFLAGHAPGAVGIPLEELADRVYELPPPGRTVRVFDLDGGRVERAVELLREREYVVETVRWDASTLTETRPSRERLWEPSPFLTEALERIRAEEHRRGQPPHRRRALDIACGTGRDAVYLAIEGYHVDAVDILPDAIEKAASLARRNGVQIDARVQDLQREPVLPPAKYDLVTVFRYLQRDLFPALRDAVTPGGYVAYETFHVRNRETGKRPLSPEHLLRDEELRDAFATFDVLIARDAEERDGRFYSCLLARRPD